MDLATVTSISCPSVFDSSVDNFLTADVTINNSTNLVHSAQIVFRGYVCKGNKLQYEFFHEQQWVLVDPGGNNIIMCRFDLISGFRRRTASRRCGCLVTSVPSNNEILWWQWNRVLRQSHRCALVWQYLFREDLWSPKIAHIENAARSMLLYRAHG